MLHDLLAALPFRNLGPSRGGRVVAVAGDPINPGTFYFGAVCGGVFKTTDAGVTWLNVSDGCFKSSSVGALAVSESNPNVIYAGMGESTIRTDVSYGDGVYKSTDAGKTWKHLGLTGTRHIGMLAVHPRNPDTVYVAALGPVFGEKGSSSEERGIFRTRDGGVTWQRVLFVSPHAGGIDVSLDANNPDVVYASIWQAHRNFWELSSGGPDSGLWRSRDGGETWTDLSATPGLEGLGLLGKIGVSASRAKPGRVYALIEAKAKPGLYRSDDFGDNWQLASDNGDLRRRPFYYMHVLADPVEADTVYVNNLGFHKSTDAGRNWTAIPTPHGDNHGLWIDPKNNQRLIQGNDGGANVSFNGGETLSSIYNQLTGQFYHITTDNQFPYRIYATQQDNSSISVPSDTVGGSVSWGDCYVAGTGESGYIAVKPDDPNIVIVGAVGSSPGGLGALQKYDHRTRQIQLINIHPRSYSVHDPANFKHRFPWTFPIVFSPHNANTLYVCGDKVWKSKDLGHSWEAISGDLTRNDVSKLKASGGPVTLDTSGAEFYCDISTFRECPHDKGVFMLGTDDGLVHLSKDGGAKWKAITPPELPEWSFVRTVEPSPHKAGTWYLCATRYKLGDFAPYVFVTRNYGKTWVRVTRGLPADEFVRVVRADPQRPGLLYAGTEFGLYVSIDDGDSWQKWGSNLPVTPIYDLVVKGDDLIIGTHGRGLWVLDDLSALREFAKDAAGKRRIAAPHLFAPGATHRVLPDLGASVDLAEGKGYGLGLASGAIYISKKDDTGQGRARVLDAGSGRDRGVMFYYAVPDGLPVDTAATLEIIDASGRVLRSYAPKPAGYDALDEKLKSLNTGPWLPVKPGVRRFVWNMRHAGALRVAGNKMTPEVAEGPIVLPGSYTARLTLGGESREVAFELTQDPRVPTSLADLEKQEKLLLRMRDKISDAHTAVNRLRDLREQVQGWRKRLGAHADIAQRAETILGELASIEDKLILPGEQKDNYGLIAHTRLNGAVCEVYSMAISADAKPTKAVQSMFSEYAEAIDDEVKRLGRLIKEDIAAFNEAIAAAALPAIQ